MIAAENNHEHAIFLNMWIDGMLNLNQNGQALSEALILPPPQKSELLPFPALPA